MSIQGQDQTDFTLIELLNRIENKKKDVDL